MNSHNQSLGWAGERAAKERVRSQGYTILASRYQCRYGEIDLIAQRDKTLCFIEVKARKNLNFGRPEDAVTSLKIKRIQKAAQHYLENENHETIEDVRFDVIAIMFYKEKPPEIHWIQGAF